MSRRSIFPLLVAGTTGILSGVYIFKPLLDNESSSVNQPIVRSNASTPFSELSQSSDVTMPAQPANSENKSS
ncbi:hypothetical protein BC835DRAFT_1355492 [Cytidiella melzeri]|nr:hypothetical protein BC835DRAFT_1355492 [Cytidiella melzeri]